MAYDECMLKGPRGRCVSWPILDPATQIHPGLTLGGGGNGVCISHGKALLADVRRGDADVYSPEGVATDLEGTPRDGSPRDEAYRSRIEAVHAVWQAASSHKYLGLRARRVVQRSEPTVERKRKPGR